MIMEQHHPQTNLVLLKNEDSYYKQYSFIEGENQTIDLEKDENGNLNFRANGDLEKPVKVQVDGKDVDKKYVSLKSGSTIVILDNEFIKTLSNGIHILGLVYMFAVMYI